MRIVEGRIKKLNFVKLDFTAKELKQVIEKNDVIVILSSKMMTFLHQNPDTHELTLINRIGESFIFADTFNSEDEKPSNFNFYHMRIKKSKQKPLKFCTNEKQLNEAQLEENQKTLFEKNCIKLKNFCLSVRASEPLTNSD